MKQLFCVIFPTWRVATAIEERVAKRGRQIKSLKTSNVQIFSFVNLILSLPNYKSLRLLNNDAFSSEKHFPTSMAF